MKRIMALVCLLLFVACLFGVADAARKQSQPVPKKAEKISNEIKTEYFTAQLPDGWSMIQAVKKQPGGGITAGFSPADGNPAITLNVMRLNMPAEELARQTAENMAKTGLKAGKIMKEGSLWKFSLSGKAAGMVWFGQHNGLTAITIILGSNLEKADQFLKALKPLQGAIFPEALKN